MKTLAAGPWVILVAIALCGGLEGFFVALTWVLAAVLPISFAVSALIRSYGTKCS